MEEQHISKEELAQKMGRQPSEISKWLSGDQKLCERFDFFSLKGMMN